MLSLHWADKTLVASADVLFHAMILLVPVNITKNKPPKLLERICNACRRRHLSLRTEKAYVNCVRRYVRYQTFTQASWMTRMTRAFLSHLAVERHVAVFTLNQAYTSLSLTGAFVFRM